MNNDKCVMEDLLMSVKGVSDLYLHGTIESGSSQVHQAFGNALTETLNMQDQIYQSMAAKGWYPTEQAQPQQINKVKQQYSNAVCNPCFPPKPQVPKGPGIKKGPLPHFAGKDPFLLFFLFCFCLSQKLFGLNQEALMKPLANQLLLIPGFYFKNQAPALHFFQDSFSPYRHTYGSGSQVTNLKLRAHTAGSLFQGGIQTVYRCPFH